MNWRVVGSDNFIYAEFAFSVDALEYMQHSPEDVREDLSIEKIGELDD